ncbi:MAG: DUF465 domain-containing protein [Caulobacter sp.]|jgi:hypothetical protein|nr:DUF465 domain-containing protein [Caulobacter sp.]
MADNDGEMIPLPNMEVRGRLVELRQRHQDLDAAVDALTSMPTPDQLQIARLKKQKLILRDQIVKLENMLIPDLLA